MNPVVEAEPPFVCPRCGGGSMGRDMEAAADGTVAVMRTVECYGHILTEWYHGSKRSPCGWRGVWPPELPPEQQPVPDDLFVYMGDGKWHLTKNGQTLCGQRALLIREPRAFGNAPHTGLCRRCLPETTVVLHVGKTDLK